MANKPLKYQYGTQAYTWLQYCQAAGEDLQESLDQVLAQVKAAGLDCWEGSIADARQAETMAALLAKHQLTMPTMYAGAKLHDADWRAGADQIIQQAKLAQPLGTKIIVCNPDPIDWGTAANKNDAQLRQQAEAFRFIATALKRIGMVLAYHNHDAELRASPRELHHMLVATADADVKFCLDVHWIYRGAENSDVALLDIISLHASRIASMHLRQSINGVWAELLGPGDVDIEAAMRLVQRGGFHGPVILEIASEAGTPRTLGPVESHRRSRQWIEALLEQQ